MQTIKDISKFVSLVEKIVREKLILDGFPIPDEFIKLLALPFKLGQMEIIDPTEKC